MLTTRTFSDTPRQHSSRKNDQPYKMVASTSATATPSAATATAAATHVATATAAATHVATATAAATYPSTSHHWF